MLPVLLACLSSFKAGAVSHLTPNQWSSFFSKQHNLCHLSPLSREQKLVELLLVLSVRLVRGKHKHLFFSPTPNQVFWLKLWQKKNVMFQHSCWLQKHTLLTCQRSSWQSLQKFLMYSIFPKIQMFILIKHIKLKLYNRTFDVCCNRLSYLDHLRL